ncbi:hypothetical protein BaRGS_00017393 [Batillaria attramentaria]|uniref:Uncharacterized protein n=1 Tax=Batillaria attramentaria TaxID=370345 RepID=A0ABD0KX15_9CAEN
MPSSWKKKPKAITAAKFHYLKITLPLAKWFQGARDKETGNPSKVVRPLSGVTQGAIADPLAVGSGEQNSHFRCLLTTADSPGGKQTHNGPHPWGGNSEGEATCEGANFAVSVTALGMNGWPRADIGL